MKNWRVVPDSVVRGVWSCVNPNCKCGGEVRNVSFVDLTNCGKPICSKENVMKFQHIVVADSSELGDGSHAEVEVELTTKYKIVSTKNGCYWINGSFGAVDGPFDTEEEAMEAMTANGYEYEEIGQ